MPLKRFAITVLSLIVACAALSHAQRADRLPAGQKWVATWAASVHGPYPAGNPSAQPDLKFAFPDAAQGAVDQSFRLIVKPDLWGDQFRIRLANTFGTQPVTIRRDLPRCIGGRGHCCEGNEHPGHICRPADRHSGSRRFRLQRPHQSQAAVRWGHGWTQARGFVPRRGGRADPMTWHAKALQTSYLSGHRSGTHTSSEEETRFPYTTTSWYFLDAVDVMAPSSTVVVCAFGDSITDGTLSTLNGDDRWPDVLSRRLHAAYGSRVSVVNAGIGGNRILTPESYPPPKPFGGGPSALQRLERDLFGLSGVSAVVLLEGINDISAGASASEIIAGMRELVSRVKAKGLKIVGATITPSLGANGNSGTPDANQRRLAVNDFIRTGGIFDAVADFDAATSIRRRAACAKSSSPTAPSAEPATDCIRIAPDIWRWATPSISSSSPPPADLTSSSDFCRRLGD